MIRISPTIVFDLDGTLVDSNRDLVPALNRTIAHDGLPPISISDVGYVVGKGVYEMIARAFDFHGRTITAQRHQELLTIYLEEYEAHIADETVFFEGTLDALDQLSLAGWTLAVCTNKYERLARKLVDLLDDTARYATITGGDTFDFKKPDPRHIIETVRRAGGDPGKAVMVGDSINDIEAARQAAIPAIGVSFGYTDIPVRDLKPNRVIDHYEELFDAAQGLVGKAT